GLFWVPMPGGNATSPAITSITTNIGTVAVSNFYLQTDLQNMGQAAQNPNNTTVPDICLALVDNTVLIASATSGTITNYFFEVTEVDQNGNYQGGGYTGNWYSAANFTPSWWGITNHTSIIFEHNKYYNIKLAVQGPCNSWDEKSIRIHVVPDLTGRFTLYNTTNTFQAISPSAGFNGWKGFICSGGTSVIKFDNTTFAANASTIYRVHITEYNPNTMQIIGTTHTTPILQASYFDGPDRTLQSILDLMPFTMQSLHYYQLRLEAGSTCKYDEGGVLWFVPLGTCKTDETGAAEETAKEESSPTGVEEVNALSDISLFPNPANSNLNIVTAIEGNINFTIYDLNGRLMQSGNFSMSSVLNVSSFASGVYQVELTTKDGNRINRKFIKQ
ncbi:MAG TPA: T9SS type A sorting domain-containing protein, partial [Chitinophagales bacterium]|nr:T9SS type A sorting domain-containing protein [Chitinophagales bacterium]